MSLDDRSVMVSSITESQELNFPYYPGNQFSRITVNGAKHSFKSIG